MQATHSEFIKLKNAYVTVEPPPPTEKTSYIDTDELEECLDLFFKGKLNEVADDYLANLWHSSIRELIPGRSLLSQVDQDMMSHCFQKLIKIHQALIKMEFLPDDEEAQEIVTSAFAFSRYRDYRDWLSSTLRTAYEELIKLLKPQLV